MSYLIIIILACVGLVGFYLNQIRNTAHGKLELKSAIALKLIKEYTGDDIMEVRSTFKKLARDYSKKLAVRDVKNFTIPSNTKDIPVRSYRNSDDKSSSLIVFIHGGGWCIGSIDSHDQQCRRLAITSGFPVLSIEYSLSPEVKFPVALHEIVDVISQISQGKTDLDFEVSQIAIIGDSAGGNMTISSALMLQEQNQSDAIKCIVPVYPVTDCSEGKEGSYTQFANGFILTRHLMDLFSENYISPDQDLKDPYLSPIYSKNLADLPPSFILTAGFDPLRDEAETFAAKLKSLGNDVKLKRYDNALHSFFGQQEFGKKGLVAIEDVSVFLKKHLK